MNFSCILSSTVNLRPRIELLVPATPFLYLGVRRSLDVELRCEGGGHWFCWTERLIYSTNFDYNWASKDIHLLTWSLRWYFAWQSSVLCSCSNQCMGWSGDSSRRWYMIDQNVHCRLDRPSHLPNKGVGDECSWVGESNRPLTDSWFIVSWDWPVLSIYSLTLYKDHLSDGTKSKWFAGAARRLGGS